jgi:hypothetical protein
VILAVNHWRCPLSPIAFDIYLPPWLAGRTMPIFGTLYVAAIAFTLVRAASAPR